MLFHIMHVYVRLSALHVCGCLHGPHLALYKTAAIAYEYVPIFSYMVFHVSIHMHLFRTHLSIDRFICEGTPTLPAPGSIPSLWSQPRPPGRKQRGGALRGLCYTDIYVYYIHVYAYIYISIYVNTYSMHVCT